MASLVLAIPVLAGGWAVITLDELPTDVQAGEPVTVGFMVRQHGITPMEGLDPTITARLGFNDKFVVQAAPEGEPGHYTAALTFPREGNWEWSIQAFSMDQPMPVLQVSSKAEAANPPVTNVEAQPAFLTPLFFLRVFVFGAALAGLALGVQRKSRAAGAFSALCLLIGVSTFVMGAAASDVRAQTRSEVSLEQSLPAQAELGRQLFLAKGCITCHYNDRAASRNEYWIIEMGAPDLSNYSAHPDVLFIRLKDPAAAKSDTKMPNLGLKKTEIEALIAFINAK
jgi:cytochrome c2